MVFGGDAQNFSNEITLHRRENIKKPHLSSYHITLPLSSSVTSAASSTLNEISKETMSTSFLHFLGQRHKPGCPDRDTPRREPRPAKENGRRYGDHAWQTPHSSSIKRLAHFVERSLESFGEIHIITDELSTDLYSACSPRYIRLQGKVCQNPGPQDLPQTFKACQ